MRSLTTIFPLGGVLLLAALAYPSCARISAPTGGPKDKEPPVILQSVPENGTKMFKSKSFTITFDEYIVLDKITDKFMVSPPLKTKPDITVKGKALEVKWDEDLADSTTYTFYFQDAIRDNNEGNTINNYQYFFSTGNVIDSLSLSGNVFNAEDLEASSDMLVMMYSNLSDTAPSKTLPAYISRPDFSGGFVIRNIKPGKYRLYALNDLNGNKKYDGDDEKFAFTDSVIEITSPEFFATKLDTVLRQQPKGKSSETTASQVAVKPDIYTFGRIRMYTFTGEQKKQYLTASDRKAAGSLLFTLARPADTADFDISIIGTSDSTWFLEQNMQRDTFKIWITDPEVYQRELLEALIKYPFTDSTNTLIYKTDTVKMRFITKQANARAANAKRSPLRNTTNIGQVNKPGMIPSFVGTNPANPPDTSRMLFIQTIDTIKTRLKPVFIKDEKNSQKLNLVTKLIPGASYSLICRKGSFSDIYGNQSDSTDYKFRISKPDDFGKLTVTISGYEGSIIIQLLNEKETVVKQKVLSSPGKVVFDLIDQGLYRLKVIYDLDNNGKWTTGDFAEKRFPEPVSYYDGEINVKVNWELEQDWDISTKNSKPISIRNKPEAQNRAR